MLAPDGLPRRATLAWLLLLYAVVLFYASTVVSPTGFTFHPADPWAQLDRLRHVIEAGWVPNGSDQRADWTANLTAMIPFGLLLAGALRVSRPGAGWALLRLLSALLALVLCVAWVLAVKYVQLWFPRTVTLNYITAQSIGALIGVALVLCARPALATAFMLLRRKDAAALRTLCLLASIWVLFFTLEPFDVALSPGDLHSRLEVLQTSLLAMPFGDRPLWMRPLLIGAGGLLAAPLGAFLWMACTKDGRTFWGRLLAQGFCVLLLVWGASLLILSATPSVFTLPSRMLGLLAGALAVQALRPAHLSLLRRLMGLLLLVPLYLLAVCAVKGLFAPGWQSLDAAWAATDPRLFLPLWTHYIVTKASAAKSVAVHAVLFAPIGLWFWARAAAARPIGLGRQLACALAAMLIATGLEIGRWLKPGLAPDFNNSIEAAVVAWGVLMLSQHVWAMLEDLVKDRTP